MFSIIVKDIRQYQNPKSKCWREEWNKNKNRILSKGEVIKSYFSFFYQE